MNPKNELHKNTGYILYIDVLGYKEILKSDEIDDISSLKEFLQDIEPSRLPVDEKLFDGCDRNKFYIRYFSDNILIFYQSITQDTKVLLGMMYLANRIQTNGIIRGFMTRGSLSYGTIEYNGRIVFGRQLVASCELEEHNINPSVCLSPSLKDYVFNCGVAGCENIMSPFGYLHTDDDSKQLCLLGIEKMIKRLNHQFSTDEKILGKYDWLIDEFNRYFDVSPKKRIVRMPSAIYTIVDE